MPFKSKAQIEHFKKMVKKGEITQSRFDDIMKETKSPESLPERINTGLFKKPAVDPKRLGGRYK